jgi:dehydrogenase/reductase SDR family member 12
VTPAARAVDALLEASVVGSFSRIGLSVRSRLLPQFTAGQFTAGQFTAGRRPPLLGRVAIVTGATSGLGRAAAIRLAQLGAAVHFLARDQGRAAEARRLIAAASGHSAVSYGLADMEDLDSIRAFAHEFRGQHDRLDVLIHNAGTIHPDYKTNDAGIELTVAGQVIAPFLLTQLLLPALLAAAPSRVITVSSAGMYAQRLDPATLEMPASGYNGVTAYARAKRAQVALSREWARHIAPADVAFHAMHPGWADTPGLAAMLPGFHRTMRPILRTPGQGADTLVWLASADPGQLGSGRFWHDRRPRSEYRFPWTREASPDVAWRLWESIAERVPA